MYAPQIRIRIATARHGIIDVSDDLVRWDVTLNEDGPSGLNFVLSNNRRKYDGVFTPNDRVSVRMKRIAWVQVFSGYLNDVPLFSVFPREVPLSATCTLKRLVHFPWDPGSAAAVELLMHGGTGWGDASMTDGGLRERTMRLLTEVGGWPESNIHIGGLPPAWFDTVSKIYDRVADRIQLGREVLGGGPVVSGRSLASYGTATLPSAIKWTGAVPVDHGKVVGGTGATTSNRTEVSGQPYTTLRGGGWWCSMRLPYRALNVSGGSSVGTTEVATPTERRAAIQWWAKQRILLVNPTTNKAVVVKVADWGPRDPKFAIRASKDVMSALGANDGADLQVRFIDEKTPLGKFEGEASSAGDPLPPATSSGAEDRPVVQTPTGNRWTSKDNLKPHVAAARDFARKAWPELAGIGGYRSPEFNRRIGGYSKSDHIFGLALDLQNGAVSIQMTAKQRALGTSIAAWFIQNPNVFGTKYVIWNNMQNSGNGWHLYANGKYTNSKSLGHYDHVHVSFLADGPTQPGPMGGAWPGSDMAGFGDYSKNPSQPGPPGFDPPQSPDGTGLIPSYMWGDPGTTIDGLSLTGDRALMNDVPLYDTVARYVQASMRSHMAAPNGDFIAWFPDYFGGYGTAGRMRVRDIEVVDDGFTIVQSDSRLKTHTYVVGATSLYNESALQGVIDHSSNPRLYTGGIATIEFPEIMEALFNIDPKDPAARRMLDSDEILHRYGARPEYLEVPTIYGQEAEFWMALRIFQQSWAKQFSTRVPLAFMPEVYPGMLIYLESHGVQVYATSVRHSGDFESGFRTTVTAVAPSATDGSGFFGLPRAKVDSKTSVKRGGGGNQQAY